MTDHVASRDIVRVNALGQRVVVVPKGHPVPEHLRQKRVSRPTEDKAVRGPSAK